MAFFYPRKQTVMIFAICIIAVGGTLYFTNTGSFKPDNTADDSLKVSAGAVKNELVQKLSDSLNSVDWKSQFFDATSTLNTTKSGTKTTVASKSDGPETLTDALGKDFFTKYVELRQAGLNTDDQTVKSAMEQVLETSLANIPAPKFFTLNDIKVSSSVTTKASLQTYSNELFVLLKNNLPTPDNNEAFIATEALEKGNMELLKKIDPIINGYKYAEAGMMAMSVPEPLAQSHLNLINAISLELSNAEAMRQSDIDPVRSLAAASMEITGLQNLSSAISKIENYLGTAGIVFSK